MLGSIKLMMCERKVCPEIPAARMGMNKRKWLLKGHSWDDDTTCELAEGWLILVSMDSERAGDDVYAIFMLR